MFPILDAVVTQVSPSSCCNFGMLSKRRLLKTPVLLLTPVFSSFVFQVAQHSTLMGQAWYVLTFVVRMFISLTIANAGKYQTHQT